MVEQAAVNRKVVGSNPTTGAFLFYPKPGLDFSLFINLPIEEDGPPQFIT